MQQVRWQRQLQAMCCDRLTDTLHAVRGYGRDGQDHEGGEAAAAIGATGRGAITKVLNMKPIPVAGQTTDQFGGGDWGDLPQEPCPYCYLQGGVQFLASENPLDLIGPQVVQCVKCGMVWDGADPARRLT